MNLLSRDTHEGGNSEWRSEEGCQITSRSLWRKVSGGRGVICNEVVGAERVTPCCFPPRVAGWTLRAVSQQPQLACLCCFLSCCFFSNCRLRGQIIPEIHFLPSPSPGEQIPPSTFESQTPPFLFGRQQQRWRQSLRSIKS